MLVFHILQYLVTLRGCDSVWGDGSWGDIVHTPTHTLNELYTSLAHLVFMIFVPGGYYNP